VSALSSEALRGFASGAGVEITAGGVTRALDPEDLELRRLSAGDLVVAEELGFFAAVDPAVTPALQSEGRARELVSRIQRLRKESGLEVSDRIVLTVSGGETVRDVLRAHGEWIASEVLATELVQVEALSGTYHATQTIDLDGIAADVAITKVS
jgi:isoleucyl-tRNA synthetase